MRYRNPALLVAACWLAMTPALVRAADDKAAASAEAVAKSTTGVVTAGGGSPTDGPGVEAAGSAGGIAAGESGAGAVGLTGVVSGVTVAAGGVTAGLLAGFAAAPRCWKTSSTSWSRSRLAAGFAATSRKASPEEPSTVVTVPTG